jgi:hypothetical protein
LLCIKQINCDAKLNRNVTVASAVELIPPKFRSRNIFVKTKSEINLVGLTFPWY